MKQRLHQYTQGIALSLIVFLSAPMKVNAADLSIATTPLFLGAAVQPNVFFVSDDSGSMDWETMAPAYWRWSKYDPDPYRTGGFSSNEPMTTMETSGTVWAAEFEGTSSVDGGFGYIYNNADNVYSIDCTNQYYRGRAEYCRSATNHPFDTEWRGRAYGLNRVFYNANILYEPWDGPCKPDGTACDNASYTDARSDPYSTQTGNAISRNLSATGDANGGAFIYEVWIDDSGFAGSRPERGDNFDETGYASTGFAAPTVDIGGNITSDAPNGIIDLWDSHMQITVDASSVTVSLIGYDPQTSSEGSPGLNETAIFTQALTGTGCYDILGHAEDVKAIRDKSLITPASRATYVAATGGANCRTIAETQQNIANWYQYYRRRAFPVKNTIAEVIDAQPKFRFGFTVLNKYSTLFTEVPPVSMTNYTAHNTQIKHDYFGFDQPSAGTPLRLALKRAGQYYDNNLSSPSGTADPIVYSCQKNFTILFTDGYWNGSSPSVGDVDGDGQSSTVADVASYFYKNDLSPLADNVKPDLPLESDLPLVALDPTFPDEKTTIQHMVTFTVAFGVTGGLVDGDGDGNPDKNAAGADWSTVGVPDKNGDWGDNSPNIEKVDDLWHAAYNSAGTYASASTPTEVSEKLINAISTIASRVGSASAVALNSGTLNANSRLYQARFNSNGWSGDIFSVPIQDGPVDKLPLGAPDGQDDSPPECDATPTVGELCDPEWSAALELANLGHASRNVYTMNYDTFTAVEFKDIADLGAQQQTDLRTNPDTLAVESASVGQDRLDYIRGDHSKELDQSGGIFRIRLEVVDFQGTTSLGIKTMLGDIISSAPSYVGAPDFFYPNSIESDKYSDYRFAERNRTGVVYVGSNDGMLHAFDALTGVEKFAYTPGRLSGRLNELTSDQYNSGHNYYVDGSPLVFDAYSGGWKTMLASSVGLGGQVVFGLDITNPDTFNATNIKWEFSDVPRTVGAKVYGDVDLGYTKGDVSFGKMNDGTWAVIFGNGYNNTEADGNASTTGNAAIYVVNAFTGELIRKFDTLIGTADDPTGAARPNGIATVTPIDLDGDFRVDYLYAGDLFGNVWKVDVTSTSTGSWEFAYQAAGDPKPFFIAKDASGVVQPITSAVAVKRHPEVRDQTIVLFGTGKYFEVGDGANAGSATQIESFYGIWDNNTGSQYARSALLEQEIKTQINVTGIDGKVREFRVTSSEKEDLVYKIDWATDKGWFMDLRYGTEYGERVVVEPIIRNNRIIFVTQTPNEDPCSAGGSSWIMELNANDGNRLDIPPFDVNGDGIIDDNDVVTYLGNADTITSGVRSKEGIVAKPGILNKKGGSASEFKYFSGTKGGIDVVTESALAEFRKRQSWRQLR